MLRKKVFFTSLLFIFSQTLFAQIPDGYYDSATGTGFTLKTQLHNIIKDHTSVSYTPGVWDAIYTTDVRPDGFVWDMYSDVPGGSAAYYYTLGSDQCGNYSGEGSCYNREHSFPKSWFNDASPMYTDLFHLYPTDGYVNGKRGNFPFGEVGTVSWESTNGSKLGACNYPGYSGTVFEPIDEYKGDFARTYFYMATRYEDIISYWETNESNADAVLNGTSDQVYEEWYLEMIIEWHTNDPVSQKEMDRNDAVYAIQANRNPFIDHPEFVVQIWGGGENVPPSITNITISPQIPSSAESVTVSATITDSDGTITSTQLNWGLSAGSLSNTINMSNSTGDNYVADAPIPAHADGTTVYYTIEAEDDSAAINTSSIQSYTVNDGGAVGLPFVEDFETVTENHPVDINGWTQYIEAGTETWEGIKYDGNLYAQFSAYNTGEASTIGWLITPALDLTGYSEVIFSFKSKDGYNNGDPLEVFISTDYPGSGDDPNGSSWIELNPTLSTGNSEGYATNWTASGDLYLNDYTENTVYIAFKYTGGDPSLTTTMQIDDVLVEGDATTNEKPVISNVLLEPENPTDEDDVILSASVDDEDGNLESVMLKWKKNEEAYVEQDMSFAEGKYTGPIVKQPAGTTIHFIILAKDDLGAETSYEDSYEVSEANAIEGVKINQAKIFPNPSTGRINIVIPGYTGKVDFKLYDAIGSLVFAETKETFNQKDMIYLQGVVSGIYLLKISANTGVTITRRLIVH